MANGARTLGIVIALVVGLAVGWFIGHGAAPPPPVPAPGPQPTPTAGPVPTPVGGGVGDHIIRVGPNAGDVNPPSAELSTGQGNVAVWLPTDPKKKLMIHFKHQDYPPEANGEPPFAGGTKDKDQKFLCDPGQTCFSGPINPNLNPSNPDYKLKYKYWQSLDAGPPADADIIIEK